MSETFVRPSVVPISRRRNLLNHIGSTCKPAEDGESRVRRALFQRVSCIARVLCLSVSRQLDERKKRAALTAALFQLDCKLEVELGYYLKDTGRAQGSRERAVRRCRRADG